MYAVVCVYKRRVRLVATAAQDGILRESKYSAIQLAPFTTLSASLYSDASLLRVWSAACGPLSKCGVRRRREACHVEVFIKGGAIANYPLRSLSTICMFDSVVLHVVDAGRRYT